MRFFLLSCYCLIATLISCQSSSHQSAETANAISIHTDFEGGSLGEIDQVADNHWRCAVEGEADSENRNRQASWYYFRVEGAKNQPLTIELTELLGEYNYKPGAHAITSETRPVISYNQTEWRHLTDEEVSWNDEDVELNLSFTPESDTVWVAHQPPYTTTNLDNLLSEYENHPHLRQESIGVTPQGKDILLLTVTHENVPQEEKQQIWIMARQHSWEAGTSHVMEGAIRYLLDASDEQLLDKVTFKLIPMADPDGVNRGGVRFNEFGHDLNRNWDLVIAEEMPEIQAQKQAIGAAEPTIDLFVTLHNTESSDYIQGPDLPVGEQFYQSMVHHTSFESEEGVRKMPETTTAGKAGRMTVNQALWAEYQIPAYLMELKVEKVDKLNGRRLVSDWLELGQGLVEATVAAVQQ